jgi:hypothetical protein
VAVAGMIPRTSAAAADNVKGRIFIGFNWVSLEIVIHHARSLGIA